MVVSPPHHRSSAQTPSRDKVYCNGIPPCTDGGTFNVTSAQSCTDLINGLSCDEYVAKEFDATVCASVCQH